MMLDPHDFSYCPNIVKTDYYGNVSYDAKWRPDDDNIGTTDWSEFLTSLKSGR